MSRRKVLVAVSLETATVMYQSDDVDVYVFDLDDDSVYIYNDKYLVVVTSVNENGTIDVKCIGETDGDDRNYGSEFIGIDPASVEFYGEDIDGLSDTDELMSDWDDEG